VYIAAPPFGIWKLFHLSPVSPQSVISVAIKPVIPPPPPTRMAASACSFFLIPVDPQSRGGGGEPAKKATRAEARRNPDKNKTDATAALSVSLLVFLPVLVASLVIGQGGRWRRTAEEKEREKSYFPFLVWPLLFPQISSVSEKREAREKKLPETISSFFARFFPPG
jgi:hypothetical protein